MLTALLITIFPTILAAILLPKIGLRPKSTFLFVTLSWFTGLFCFTVLSFFVALFLTTVTHDVLLKALYIVLLGVQVCLLFFVKDGHRMIMTGKLYLQHKRHIKSFLLIFFCFAISALFFAPHVIVQNEKLYTTDIYWDFHWHAALISNFAYGDNFPPQNEAFSGLPHTYHYFWGVAAALYVVAGLDLAAAITGISILAFAFMLIGIIGLSEELFRSKFIGLLAVFLTLTSGSLHFFYDIITTYDKNLSQTIASIIQSAQHPWSASFLPGNLYDYNGTMFNLFYFLEERQMIFGVVYLLLATWILFKRDQFNNQLLFWLGAALGAYFLWHLYITIMVLCALLFLLVFDKHRKKTLLLLAGFSIIFGAHYLYFRSVMQSVWFYQDIGSFPRFNVDFASIENQPFSLSHFLIWYGFSYGLKLVFLPIGLFVLYKKDKKVFLLLSAIILPAFLLINLIQLSPATITENHKWLRPMNIFIDLIIAFIIYQLFFRQKQIKALSIGILSLLLLSISGIIENKTFFEAKPEKLYAAYPSSITKAVKENSAPQDTFIGTDTAEINLAGRKVFVGKNLGGEIRFKTQERKQIVEQIYQTTTLTSFCSLTQKYDIDFVQINSLTHAPLQKIAKELPHFSAINSKNLPVYFVNVKKSCR